MCEPSTVLTDSRACYNKFPDCCKSYGPLRNGLPNGQDIELWPNGAVRYEGRCENREDNENGVYTGLDGSYYNGEFEDSQWHGNEKTCEPSAVPINDHVSYTFTDGYKYYGSLWNGLPHGQGITKWPNGDMFYKGQFENGKAHGRGVYTGLDGYRYEGDFMDGIAHGHGVAAYPSGSIYVGTFKAAKRHGKGILTFPDGGKYTGDWENDKMHGLGTYTWSDGLQKYKGLWKEGKKHGLGVMTDADGNILHLSLNEMLLHLLVLNSLRA